MRRSKQIDCMVRTWWLAFLLLFVSSCGKVTMQPALSSSVGFDAFQELGHIRRAPVHVAILIDQKLLDLVFHLEHGSAKYNAEAGKAIAAKVVKLASYLFDEVSIVKKRDAAAPLLLHVGLQSEQPGLAVDVSKRFLSSMYDVSTKIDIRIRASLADRTGTIWVGAARVTDELQTGALEASGGIDISRAISETLDRSTDRLVADLMRQVRRSESLARYLAREQ